MCTFKKAIKNFEVHVDVQKGALGSKEKMTIDVSVSVDYIFM